MDILKLLGTQQGAAGLGQRLGLPGTALQQQGLGVFANLLAQPTGQQRVFEQAMPALQAQFTGTPGGDVLNAAQPIFQRNLAEALSRQGEVGPRFASAAQREARTLEQQGLQDINLFSQQILESGRQRQIQAALAASQIGQGADQSILNILSGAGGFAQGAQGGQLALLQMLIPALFGGGLSPGTAVGPSVLSQIAGVASAVGSTAMGIPGLGGGGGPTSGIFAGEGALRSPRR